MNGIQFSKARSCFTTLFFFVAIIFFNSCSMHEEIDISTNGSGYYDSRIDMSPMLEMMAGMGALSDQPDSIKNEVRDTVISLSAMAKGMEAALTSKELAYINSSLLRMQVNMKENKMQLGVKAPIKNTSDLNAYFKAVQRFDSLLALKKPDEAQAQAGAQMPNLLPSLGGGGLPGGNNSLPMKPSPYVVTDTSIERLVISKEELTKEMGDQAEGAAMFFGQVNYTTTIKLPRTVKRMEGKNLKLGDDKRSVFFSASLQELIDNPAGGGFKVVF